MFDEATWNSNAMQVYEVAKELLGENLRKNCSGMFSAHPVWRFAYPLEFNPNAVQVSLAERLDALGWQVVNTDERTPDDGMEQWRYLVTAPRLKVMAEIIYHVAPVRMIPLILREGLLPSNETRSRTKYPDTMGKIYGSLRLAPQPGEGDGAAFWVTHFGERYAEPFGILEVDLTQLPDETRIYRDTHSHWGVVIDRVECIPSSQLREVTADELPESIRK